MTESGADGIHRVRVLMIAGISIVSTTLTPFLFGALSVFIRKDLYFSERELGLAVSGYFLSSATFSILGGRIADQLGHRRALRLATVCSALSGVAMATLASSWLHVVAVLALAGLANAVVQPATNLALAREIPPHLQGRAFGLKQSAGPGAALLAGVAVPGIALTVGWRWAFAIVIVSSALTWMLTSRDGDTTMSRVVPLPTSTPGINYRHLVGLAAGVTLAASASTGLTIFYVESAVSLGHAAGVAGILLAVGSGFSILIRITLGRWTDTQEIGIMTLVIRLLVLGALGFALLAYARSIILLVFATVLVFGAGWGWPGLYQHGIVRLHPEAPGTATGITMMGVFLGGVLGPFAFGSIVQAYSYLAAWWVSVFCLVVSAVLTWFVVNIVRRERASTRPTGNA